MVRTKGLGRVLGWAIGKALRRRDASDDDVSQQRNPTASACSQRLQERVVEDPPKAAEKLNKEQPEAPMEDG